MYKMESYCLRCKKNTENIDPNISSTSNGKAKGLFSKLGIKTPLSKVPILGDILF